MLGSEEHTILLGRKRLNQEMKKKNVYNCSCSHLILDHHRYHYLHCNAKLVPRSFRAVQLLYNTVGYPREQGRWPLNKGWRTLNVFSLSGYKILVNMEPIQGNHDRREPIFAYPSFPTLFHLLDKVLCLYNGRKFLPEPCTC